MTPKEKAEELVKKYHKDVLNTNYFGHKKAKQCALIAVEEIIEAIQMGYCEDPALKYWQEVKQEIEKL